MIVVFGVYVKCYKIDCVVIWICKLDFGFVDFYILWVGFCLRVFLSIVGDDLV